MRYTADDPGGRGKGPIVAVPLGMPPGAGGRGHTGLRNDTSNTWTSQGARAPSAMPLSKAAPGPRANGYHGEASTGVAHGPLGRNDGVLYGRMPGGENAAQMSMWAAQGMQNMRHGGLGDGRMQGLPSLRAGGDGLEEGMSGMQLHAGGGDGGMARAQRPKIGEGERQEETDDDMFAMFRFKVRATCLCFTSQDFTPRDSLLPFYGAIGGPLYLMALL